jgi:carotenoid cleavage dioxygenase-like enzyme
MLLARLAAAQGHPSRTSAASPSPLQDLPVVLGELPADLHGCYLRNGSNPYYDPYASYHWFEVRGRACNSIRADSTQQ